MSQRCIFEDLDPALTSNFLAPTLCQLGDLAFEYVTTPATSSHNDKARASVGRDLVLLASAKQERLNVTPNGGAGQIQQGRGR